MNVPAGWTAYKNIDYNFALAYPENIEINQRAVDKLDSTYAGLSGKFFVSVRDIKRENEAVTLALFYAFKNLTIEEFSTALVTSDQGNITIKETTDVIQNGIVMKKIISTTAMGMDKTHYLFTSGDNLIVISIVLGEEEAFKPVFETMVDNF